MTDGVRLPSAMFKSITTIAHLFDTETTDITITLMKWRGPGLPWTSQAVAERLLQCPEIWAARDLAKRKPPQLYKDGRAVRGTCVPSVVYQRGILLALYAVGNRDRKDNVIERVAGVLSEHFSFVDRSPIPSNPDEPRYVNHIRQARRELAEWGRIYSKDVSGYWELAPRGVQAAILLVEQHTGQGALSGMLESSNS